MQERTHAQRETQLKTQKEAQSEARRFAPYFRSPAAFALPVAAGWLVFFNVRFWRELGAHAWQGQWQDLLFLGCVALLLLLWLASLLLMLPGKHALKLAVALLFPMASMAAYCADSFGVVIDKDMFRNFSHTDSQEVQALLSPRLAWYVAGLGVLPVFLVARSRIGLPGPRRAMAERIALWGATLGLTALALAVFPARWQAVAHDLPQLRYLLVPVAAIEGGVGFVHGELKGWRDSRLAAMPAPPQRQPAPPGAKPLLVFMVIGETARHRNFQLGGYARATNPALARLDGVVYFGNATACATSTAQAVPCMLSPYSREHFNPALARRSRNVIDELRQAGVRVSWRSNNSGSKAVDARIEAFRPDERTTAALCDAHSCLDEILLTALAPELARLDTDGLIVFHDMGSHGPAYHQRYPASAEVFRPACRDKDPRRCTREELINAYDNTIVYTDRLLAEKISLLRQWSERFDTALIYVSDHGESLGEQGIYLHSSPYDIAPEEQKRVPLLLWTSPGFAQRSGLDAACLRTLRDKPASHANVYHTLLGALRTRTASYNGRLDLLAGCASARG